MHSYRRLFQLILLVVLVQTVFAQQRVAILGTEDDGEPPLNHNELSVLTDKLREIAVNTLPKTRYDIMTSETMVSFLGSQEKFQEVCEAAESCLVKIGRDIEADYIGQARLKRVGKLFSISINIHDVKKGTLVGTFMDNSSKDIHILLEVIEKKAPNVFRDMPGVSNTPIIVGGIGAVKSASDYEFSGEKRYLASIITEPEGAALSIDGRPVAGCAKTPCKVTLTEGKFRIIAAMEQYEEADTTVTVKQNNQNIVIKLKPNFGVLSVKAAYIDGLGKDDKWQFVINDKAVSSWSNRLSPGKYTVKLSHRCYEDISFDFGINKGAQEVFDMMPHIKLKKGGLILDAERNGEPISEPVFVNGKREGETPFSGTVPLCAEIKVGGNMVNVELKHNENVKFVVTEEKDIIAEAMREADRRAAQEANRIVEQEELDKEKALRDGWKRSFSLGGSYITMLNAIDSLLTPTVGAMSISVELYKGNFDFLHIGLNFGTGIFSLEDEIKKTYPDADSIIVFLFNLGAYVKLYPVNFLYLQGGINICDHYYKFITSNNNIESDITMLSFPIGGGLKLTYLSNDDVGAGVGFYLEGLYNILQNRSSGYLSINAGFLLWF